eukprot:Gb_28243 [translate_table: standard]
MALVVVGSSVCSMDITRRGSTSSSTATSTIYNLKTPATTMWRGGGFGTDDMGFNGNGSVSFPWTCYTFGGFNNNTYFLCGWAYYELGSRLASTRPLRVSDHQANSSSPPSRGQSSITRFFPTTLNARRVSAPRTRSSYRVVQPSPTRPRLSLEDFIQQCIGSFTVVGDSTEMPSPSATITASIGTLNASSSVVVM